MKKGMIDGPAAIIIFIAIFIIITAFLYPILKPIVTWFISINVIFKIGLLIMILLTSYVLVKELSPRSVI